MTNTQKLNIFVGVDLQKVYAENLFNSNKKDLETFKKFLTHELNNDYTHRIFVTKENYRLDPGDYSLIDEVESLKDTSGYSVVNRKYSACHNCVSMIMQAVSKARLEQQNEEIPVINKINICGFNTSTSVLANVMLIKSVFPTSKVNLITNLCKDFNKRTQAEVFSILKQHVNIIAV